MLAFPNAVPASDVAAGHRACRPHEPSPLAGATTSCTCSCARASRMGLPASQRRWRKGPLCVPPRPAWGRVPSSQHLSPPSGRWRAVAMRLDTNPHRSIPIPVRDLREVNSLLIGIKRGVFHDDSPFRDSDEAVLHVNQIGPWRKGAASRLEVAGRWASHSTDSLAAQRSLRRAANMEARQRCCRWIICALALAAFVATGD